MADHILSFLYLLALAIAGWRLFRLRWPRYVRVLVGALLVLLTPMLFIVPALLNPRGGFADLQMAIGIGMLAAGAVALLGGMGVAWLGQRGRKA